MKRNFTLGLAVFVLVALMTAVVNAQDADNPWHLIAFENDVEVAFYNTEMITGMEVTAQNVTIALDNGKKFSHPIATTTFGFDPRKEGTATANETVIVPLWSVFYANGRLHFSEPVSGISVFTMYGALAARFEGNITEVPVNLPQGFYIVQADGKSAKLFVNNSDNGSAPAKPLLASQPVANTSNPVNLRAGNIKIYWNITASSSTLSVEIPNVEKFHFTADNSIVFTLKNGNTIELADYQGIEFTVEPAPTTTTSNWDLDLTMRFGGVSYVQDITHADVYDISIIAVANDRVIAENILGRIPRMNVLKKNITNPNFWSAKLTIFCYTGRFEPTLAQCYEIFEYEDWQFKYDAYYPNNELSGILTRKSMAWVFNNNQPFIQASIRLNANDSLTVEFKDVRDGKVYSYTFPAP